LQNPKANVTLRDVKLAIFSIHTNVCAWCFFCTNVCVQGMAAFVPTLLRELGWTSTQAQLLSVPPYAVAAVATILLGYISDRKKKRGIYIASVIILPIIGFGILRFSRSVNARYAAIYLNAIGAFSASSGFLAWGINSEYSSIICKPHS
jgi:MFS family permease